MRETPHIPFLLLNLPLHNLPTLFRTFCLFPSFFLSFFLSLSLSLPLFFSSFSPLSPSLSFFLFLSLSLSFHSGKSSKKLPCGLEDSSDYKQPLECQDHTVDQSAVLLRAVRRNTSFSKGQTQDSVLSIAGRSGDLLDEDIKAASASLAAPRGMSLANVTDVAAALRTAANCTRRATMPASSSVPLSLNPTPVDTTPAVKDQPVQSTQNQTLPSHPTKALEAGEQVPVQHSPESGESWDAPPPYDANFHLLQEAASTRSSEGRSSLPPKPLPRLTRETLAVFTLQQFTLSEKMERFARVLVVGSPPQDAPAPPPPGPVEVAARQAEEVRRRVFGAMVRRTVV